LKAPHRLKNSELHFANVTDPRIPVALADIVLGPVALHDFKPRPLTHSVSCVSIDGSGTVRRAVKGKNGQYTFDGCGDECHAFTPGDAQTIYNIKPLLAKGITGKGQIIGLIEDGDAYTAKDWKTFTSTFGLSKYGTAHPSGSVTCTASGDSGSAMCDGNYGYSVAEWGTNVNGWAATPYNVAVGGTDFGDSYAGTTSTYWNTTNNGDYSSAKSYVPEIPWNNSCASELISTTEGFSTTYGKNGFCNSTLGQEDFLTLGAGSGGPSACFTGAGSDPNGLVSSTGSCKGQSKPSWQSVYGNPSDGVRDLPDLSLFAANGIWGHYIIICISNISETDGAPCIAQHPQAWTGIGGTSASAPMMAGIQALVNQKAGNGLPQGNPAPVYYALAAKEYGSSGNTSCNSTLGGSVGSSCTFHDITQGDMNTPCYVDELDPKEPAHNCYFGNASGTGGYGVGSTVNKSYKPAYKATKGWDFATGLGSVDAYNLAQNWNTVIAYGGSTVTTLTATPQSVPQGTNFTLTATVSLKDAGRAPGSVTFKTGSTTLGSCTLSSGTCSANVSSSSLSPGTYPVIAHYSGQTSGGYKASISAAVNVVVGAAASIATSTAFSISEATITQGDSTTLTATVTAASGQATGKVVFSPTA